MPERYSTRASYQSMLKNHIRPRWGDYPLDGFKPMAVEQWLRELKLAPKTKANVRSLMYLIFTCAERWCLIEMGKNPIALVRVKNSSKRLRRPRVLTVEEFYAILEFLCEPFKTMVLMAQCLGLRVSEIMALKWSDFDFEALTLLVQRAIVHGRVDEVKTEYSHDHVPLDVALAQLLHSWRMATTFPEVDDWVLANPSTGKPNHQEEIQKRHIKVPAEKLVSIARSAGTRFGTHIVLGSMRRRSNESAAGARHASIQTTMNVYGRVMTETKRKANSGVVNIVLGRPKPVPSIKVPGTL
jgi:integrase